MVIGFLAACQALDEKLMNKRSTRTRKQVSCARNGVPHERLGSMHVHMKTISMWQIEWRADYSQSKWKMVLSRSLMALKSPSLAGVLGDVGTDKLGVALTSAPPPVLSAFRLSL